MSMLLRKELESLELTYPNESSIEASNTETSTSPSGQTKVFINDIRFVFLLFGK